MHFVKEAWPFVLPFAVGAVVLLALGLVLTAAVVLVLGLLVLLFFRDPVRSFDGSEEILLAAADGRVTRVDRIADPEVGPGEHLRIATFLSVFDVHVQRSPVSGRVVHSRYARGRKLAAFHPEADRLNEWQLTVLEPGDGERVGVRQIAGLVARRVVPYLKPGDTVRRGDHLGVIKFGSRVDVLMPAGYQPLVEVGDRVSAGQTPLATRSAGP